MSDAPSEDAPTIETRADLEDVFEELADINTELNRKQATQKKAVRRAKREHADRIDELAARLSVLTDAVKGYCRANRDQLVEQAGKKTIELSAGNVQYRSGRETIVFDEDKETLAERLESAGLGHLVGRKISLSKRTLMKHRDEIEDIAGVRVERGGEKIKLKPI